METDRFSITEAVKYGWEVYKKNFWFLVITYLIIFAIQFAMNLVISVITEAIPEEYALVIMVVSIALSLLSLGLSLGMMGISLALVKSEPAEYKDLFKYFNGSILSYFIASLLYVLLVGIGFVLLIVPGIYFILKYQFYGYAIVERGDGPVVALKRSAEMTKGIKLHLLVFGLALFGINFLGMLALLVGLLITAPTTYFAYITVYRYLSERLEDTPYEQPAVASVPTPPSAPEPSQIAQPVPPAPLG